MPINVRTYYQTPNATNSVTDSDILVVQQMGSEVTPAYNQMKKTTVGTILSGAIRGVKVNNVELNKDAAGKVNVTVPTVNDSIITIKKSDGTTIDSFTLNQSTGKNITLPELGKVDDVKTSLDGSTYTSVVINKEAKIDLSGKENISNKVTSISSSSTDTQYPSAKCVNSAISNISSQKADKPVTGSLSLPTASWTGSASPYSQTITISGSTSNSKIDIEMDNTAISQMLSDGTNAIYVVNNNGTLTAYAVGTKPSVDLAVQFTRTEVA